MLKPIVFRRCRRGGSDFHFSDFDFFFLELIQEVAIKITTILQKQQEEKTSKLHKC